MTKNLINSKNGVFVASSFARYICYSPAGRSVLGETVKSTGKKIHQRFSSAGIKTAQGLYKKSSLHIPILGF